MNTYLYSYKQRKNKNQIIIKFMYFLDMYITFAAEVVQKNYKNKLSIIVFHMKFINTLNVNK